MSYFQLFIKRITGVWLLNTLNINGLKSNVYCVSALSNFILKFKYCRQLMRRTLPTSKLTYLYIKQYRVSSSLTRCALVFNLTSANATVQTVAWLGYHQTPF